MSRNTVVAESTPATGITRDLDLELDCDAGVKTNGAAPSQARIIRGGQVGTLIGVSKVSTTLSVQNGRQVWQVTSGLGNGCMIVYGCQVATLSTTDEQAFAVRRGITRFVSTMWASSLAVTPNDDVGMQFVIGGTGVVALMSQNLRTGAADSGFGIWLLDAGGANSRFCWAVKNANTVQGVSDVTPLNPLNSDSLVPIQYEIRVFDWTEAENAKVQVIVKGTPVVTRYWENPAGVVTPVLPPLNATAGGAIYPQIRNTSTGPAFMYFGGFSYMHGPNNEGTT